MEYAPGGELHMFQKQQPNKCLSEELAAYYLMQVSDALFYIHNKKIIHRDIKTENILLCNNLAKIADFGYSRVCDDKESRNTYCGTLDYMSPEIVKGEKYNKQVDVWALGVMAYELMQGVTPFYERTRKGTLQKIEVGQFKFVKQISEEAQSFITGLLNVSMANRQSIKQQLKHHWMVKHIQLFDKQMKEEMNAEINNISFLGSERIYDKDASNKQVRNPYTSFVFLNKFLGALENDRETFETAKQYYEEYLISIDSERHTVLFELQKFYLNDPEEKIILSVEEVVAMILKTAKKNAEIKAELQNIRDCVITVPTNYSLRTRTALVQAARIAGLSPLNLIHENTAAALHFGITKLEEGSSETVLFYNMGATTTQASLVEYQFINNTSKFDTQKSIPVITVLADYAFNGIGGYAQDLALAQYFADVIDKMPNRKGLESFRKNRRGMVKLLKECNKAKEVLSANKDFQFFSEGLLEGSDFTSNINRTIFENINQQLFEKVTIPIQKVLERSNKTLSDINKVELIGGSIRVPKVQQILQEYLQELKPGFHLNGDEAMAQGAAFHAANYSSSFRVKKIYLNDGYNFDIRMKIQDLVVDENQQEDKDGEENKSFQKETVLFQAKKRFGSRKTLTFKHDKDLKISLFTQDYEGNTQNLVSYIVNNITQITQNEKYQGFGKPKLSLMFELGSIKIVDMIQVNAALNITQIVEVENIKPVETKNIFLRNYDGENGNEQENDGEELKDDGENLNVNLFNNQTEKQFQTKYKLQHFDLDVEETIDYFIPLNQTQIEQSQKKLERFDNHQEQIKIYEKEKNTLESLIYQIREYKDDETYLKFSVQQEVDDAVKLSDENEEWLTSEESNSAKTEDFKKRSTQIYNVISPVINRINEYEKRPKAMNVTKSKILDFVQKVERLNVTHSHITSEQKIPVYLLLNETITWINDVEKKQSEAPLNVDPLFTILDLDSKVNEIKKEFDKLKLIQKPKDDKKSDKKEDANKKKKEKKQEDKKEENNEEKKEQQQQKDEKEAKEEEQQQQQQQDNQNTGQSNQKQENIQTDL
ncbi:hypothetical protein IMG5_009240 [Ichthyophthirius multifiliis]|uniref:Protein kinase domain-containing protein n=1 Tax=Ichthyophthirius multifiliis TaxID=5932 RepID=G0QJU1_ICHMU|nr:hypothetical protein IMG5_009240 [Ichthyophthirius multifiliis]EGR34515.1 hypothetical protein IMG5_009240 [Ichthyophthirius multifiliis]|eukprot:XP_004039819.1 hypothetical protein IMG5_009240 [Ichthyophthirius multifiliis]